ncbi:hypothetical protein BJX99DRAFT_265773 [Aspergillus californicus]
MYAANSTTTGADLDTDDWGTLGSLLADWYVGDDSPLKDRQTRTIGYGLHTEKPKSVNEQAPTFPPTALKFQTYEYRAPGQDRPPEGLGAGDNNAMLYLQMTDHQDFPSDAILRYEGIFVAAGKHGTKFEIGLGASGRNDEFFFWDSGKDWQTTKWKPSAPEQTYNHLKDTDADWNRLEIDCRVDNKIETAPGRNTVDISGTTRIEVHGSGMLTLLIPNAWSYDYRVEATVTWSITATLKAVENGGIEISLGLPSDPAKIYTITTETLESDFNGTKDLTESYKQEVKDSLKQQLDHINLGEVEQELQTNLNGASRFVVPGGGYFTYDSPVFNDHGDLLLDVQYSDE